jgi:tetratricopeptide (TPR) repeat protein
MQGLFVVDGGFELMCGDAPVGDRRHLDAAAVVALQGFSRRYYDLLRSPHAGAGLLALGRDLYGWLDGQSGVVGTFLQRADRPLRFEVCAAKRYLIEAEWALLRAPWEVLADQQGFLAGEVPLGFSPVRRLGQAVAPPALDKLRLGLMFMAASPRGARELDYEREETAIMAAVGSTRLDLLVEESGNPRELAERLTEYQTMQALHLSCHGDNAWRPSDRPDAAPKAVLLLEDDEGEQLPTDAGELIAALRAHRPRLVFLSACLTAATDAATPGGLGDKEAPTSPRTGVAHSLAEALVGGGLPAVLGWDGSVADGAATAFAATLYDGLEGQQDLADAVAAARRELLNAAEDYKRRDWHLARVWLGPQGGGPIVGGNVRRKMMPATHGEKEFLDRKSLVPVASHEMFVGRRRELQTALRALRESDYAGVLLHGMGRLGKSSLAARIANRRRDLKVAVVFEHYGARDVLSALSEALRDNPEARELLRKGTDLVRQDRDRLEDVLGDLLRGPCAQTEAESAPILLVIDDLERILVADPNGGRHRVKPDNAPVLKAVLRAFGGALGVSNCRIVITSRFTFALDGLEQRLFELPLPPLSEPAQHKLELRQKEAATDAGLTGEAFEERATLLARVPAIARGNPGLQDLIGRRLILSSAVAVERAKQTLDEMDAWLQRGDPPSDAEVRQFLEDLAVDLLLDLAGKPGRDALRDLTLFDLPVPETVPGKVATQRGVSLAHLRDLGLLDVFPDLVDPRRTALAVNALVAGRLEPLTRSEQDKLARAATRDLFVAWGGAEAEAKRPSPCDLVLTRLGLIAEDGEIVGVCATGAMLVLRQGRAAVAAAFGRAAIDLLDRQVRPVPWRLLSETASMLSTSGDGATADTLLERGVGALEEQRRAGVVVDPVAAGFLFYEQARRLETRGDLDGAQRLFTDSARLAAAVGNEVNVAIARGAIANILQSRGEFDEALRIRREEQLPVYERLGNLRSRALTMGRIADILESRGDVDEALRIRREEQLPVFERLGDARERAVTMGEIADTLLSRGELDEALRIRMEEELPVFERLGDVHSRAVTMGNIADILMDRGDLDEALRIRREEQLPVFERLGDVRSRAVAMGKITDILERRGDLDESLRILRDELLPAFERLGLLRERAVIMGRIADIMVKKGDKAAARVLQEDRLRINTRLDDQDGRAATLWSLSQLDLSEMKPNDGIPRIVEAYAIVQRLGRAEGIAVIGQVLGQILAASGELDQAHQVLRGSAEMYSRLGRTEDAQEVERMIRELGLD